MKTQSLLIYTVAITMLIALSACSSHIPTVISNPATPSPDLTQVQSSPEDYLSKELRWGGIILGIENKKDTSQLTIIAYPLSDNGEPQISKQSTGRFIAIINGFLEPTIYAAERKMTFVGNLLKTETQKIGEFDYKHPVIQVAHYYLWPAETDYDEANYPPYWWHDPWYHPYYPYYPHRHIH